MKRDHNHYQVDYKHITRSPSWERKIELLIPSFSIMNMPMMDQKWCTPIKEHFTPLLRHVCCEVTRLDTPSVMQSGAVKVRFRV